MAARDYSTAKMAADVYSAMGQHLHYDEGCLQPAHVLALAHRLGHTQVKSEVRSVWKRCENGCTVYLAHRLGHTQLALKEAEKITHIFSILTSLYSLPARSWRSRMQRR